MGKLKRFKVVLTETAVYGGQWLSGKLIVELREAMSMKGLYLRFRGRSEVYIKSGRNGVTAEKVFFDALVLLKGEEPEAEADNISLAAGKYEFPFRFQVPDDVPSSYEIDQPFSPFREQNTGCIGYQVKGVIKKPWKCDQTVKKKFTVIQVRDLNKLVDALVPQRSNSEKTLGSVCCSSGVLSAWISSDRFGYVPGEQIRIAAEINNITSRAIRCSKINLLSYTTFTVGDLENTIARKLVKVRRGPIAPGGRDAFDNLVIIIPPVQPSYLDGCDAMNIEYCLQMRVQPRCSPALVVSHEIIIGSVPIATSPQPGSTRERHQVPHETPGGEISTVPMQLVSPSTEPRENQQLPPQPSVRLEDMIADLETYLDENQGSATSFEMVQINAPLLQDEEMAARGQRHLGGTDGNELPPPSYRDCVW